MFRVGVCVDEKCFPLLLLLLCFLENFFLFCDDEGREGVGGRDVLSCDVTE